MRPPKPVAVGTSSLAARVRSASASKRPGASARARTRLAALPRVAKNVPVWASPRAALSDARGDAGTASPANRTPSRYAVVSVGVTTTHKWCSPSDMTAARTAPAREIRSTAPWTLTAA